MENIQITLENEDDNVCRTCAFTGPSDYYNVNDNSIKFNHLNISLKAIIGELTDIKVNYSKKINEE